MAIENICEKIINDAKAEADIIKKENSLELEKKLEEKDFELSRETERVRRESQVKIAQMKEQYNFRARLIEKKASLVARQEIVNLVFDSAREKLVNVSDQDFIEIFVETLKKAPKLNGAKAVFSEKRKKLAIKILAKAGLKYKIANECLPKDKEGLLLKSDSVDVNLTIDAILGDIRESVATELAKILFNNQLYGKR